LSRASLEPLSLDQLSRGRSPTCRPRYRMRNPMPSASNATECVQFPYHSLNPLARISTISG
jgi:hypothetical protein